MATNQINRAKRTDVSLSAELKVGENRFACSMQNLTVGGAKIITAMPMSKGDTQELVIGDFKPISFDVAWARPPLFGLKFEEDAQEEVAEILMSVATYSAS